MGRNAEGRRQKAEWRKRFVPLLHSAFSLLPGSVGLLNAVCLVPLPGAALRGLTTDECLSPFTGERHCRGDQAATLSPADSPAASASRRTRNARASASPLSGRSEEHTSELQSQSNLVCRLLLEKKKT